MNFPKWQFNEINLSSLVNYISVANVVDFLFYNFCCFTVQEIRTCVTVVELS